MDAASRAVARRDLLAKAMGYESLDELDYKLNRLIKVGTDGFKTLEWDREQTERDLTFVQKALENALNKIAPWTHWKRSNWAFRRGIPEFYREDMAKGSHERRNSIPTYFDGTVAQICRLTLPSLQAMLKTPIEQKPLSAFRGWALPVEEWMLEDVKALQQEYNGRVRRVNWSDPADVSKFRTWWQGRVHEWMEREKVTEREAVSALWRVAHATRSDQASGASVFIAFPEAVKWIVGEKPGLNRAETQTMVLGLHYVFDNPVHRLTAEVEVREFTQVKKGRTLVRKVVCGHVPGKKDARQPYPADLLGMVDARSEQPEVGRYVAHIVKSGNGKAWHCQLRAM
jgi:hypothetical protein